MSYVFNMRTKSVQQQVAWCVCWLSSLTSSCRPSKWGHASSTARPCQRRLLSSSSPSSGSKTCLVGIRTGGKLWGWCSDCTILAIQNTFDYNCLDICLHVISCIILYQCMVQRKPPHVGPRFRGKGRDQSTMQDHSSDRRLGHWKDSDRATSWKSSFDKLSASDHSDPPPRMGKWARAYRLKW